MENRLRRGPEFGIAEEGMPGVRITIETREVGASDLDPETMARMEHHTCRP